VAEVAIISHAHTFTNMIIVRWIVGIWGRYRLNQKSGIATVVIVSLPDLRPN